MRHIPLLIIAAIVLLASACGQQGRGHRHLTTADSLRRARAIAEESHLTDMEQVHESLTGPEPATGSGVVAPGGAAQVPQPGDSIAQAVRAHDRWHKRLEQALADSATALGALITRVLVQDSIHRYTTATYTGDGHLLTFHSEQTPDEHERAEYDLCFDRGHLVHVHERHLYAGDTEGDDQAADTYTDDTYYLAHGRVYYHYRKAGEAVHHMDRIEYIQQHHSALQGDIAGHLSRVYDNFVTEYDRLTQQPMEVMVYTAVPREVAHVDGQ
ncbi:MAG: hypothetical protein JSS76_09030 [Bacteroidetes bacterium]|nr:hypothetical protein [Bacteroidota bacterium]